MKNNPNSIVENQLLQSFYEKIKRTLRGIIKNNNISTKSIFIELYNTSSFVLDIFGKGDGNHIINSKVYLGYNEASVINTGDVLVKLIFRYDTPEYSYILIIFDSEIVSEFCTAYDLTETEFKNIIINNYTSNPINKSYTEITNINFVTPKVDTILPPSTGDSNHADTADRLSNGIKVTIYEGDNIDSASGSYKQGGTIDIYLSQNNFKESSINTEFGLTINNKGLVTDYNDNWKVKEERLPIASENSLGVIRGGADRVGTNIPVLIDLDGRAYVDILKQIPDLTDINTDYIPQLTELSEDVRDGEIVLYIGESDNYINGYFYKYNKSDDSWSRIDVQPKDSVNSIEFIICDSPEITPDAAEGELSPSDANTNNIYLVEEVGIESDQYAEYIVIYKDGQYQWEKLGYVNEISIPDPIKYESGDGIIKVNNDTHTISADLSNYSTTEEVKKLIEEAQFEESDTDFTLYVKKSEVSPNSSITAEYGKEVNLGTIAEKEFKFTMPAALKYTEGSNIKIENYEISADLSNYYTKSEVDNLQKKHYVITSASTNIIPLKSEYLFIRIGSEGSYSISFSNLKGSGTEVDVYNILIYNDVSEDITISFSSEDSVYNMTGTRYFTVSENKMAEFVVTTYGENVVFNGGVSL